MRPSPQRELLDHAPPAEARANLADLVRINRWFGGRRLVAQLAAELLPADKRCTVLDVGAASGDMGAALRRTLPLAQVISLDRSEHHLHAAPFPKLVGDAFALPFAPRSVDVVMANLFLHHFSDDEIICLLKAFRNVSRRGVLIIDLLRHPVARYFLPATRWLFRWNSITLHDGPVSVDAAFQRRELTWLAKQAGYQYCKVRCHHPWFRLSLVEKTE